MGAFFEIVESNEMLNFIDESNNTEYKLEELNLIDFENSSKELVFLYSDNSIHAMRWFWSIMKSQHVLVLLCETLNNTLKKSLEDKYEPKFIVDRERSEISGYKLAKFERLFIRKNPRIVNIHDKIKLLLSTSGTTGSPKFVKLSEKNLISNALEISRYLNIQKIDVAPLNLPIYYSYGLSVLTSNSFVGNTITCSNTDILNRNFWNNLERFKYNSIAGVPMVYEMLDRIGFMKKIYPSLRYITQAGGKLSNELILKYANYCEKNQIDFFIMYGATEATARMSFLEPNQIKNKIGSIGKPLKCGKFLIDSVTDELLYCGPNVFGGYSESFSDLNAFEEMSCLKTGDLARVDQDGYYFITGRIKRIIKLFGLRINLDEIEQCLTNKLGNVIKCLGIEDKKIAIFFCELIAKDSEIIEILTGTFKIHISYILIIKIDEFPITPNGKTDYNALYNLI